MSLQVAAHQTEGYRVNTPDFEGPLDLLLQLIDRAELDISSFALAQVTDQYLGYLHALQEKDAAEVSAFLVIAARLMLIKSAALLPRPALTVAGAEEDPGEALARQLLLYKKFKQSAEWLGRREEQGLRTYLRTVPAAVKVEARLDLEGVTLKDLLDAARSVLFNRNRLPPLNQVVSIPRVTIREKIRSIIDAMHSLARVTFQGLLHNQSDRLEMVVTFLAMLELVKRRLVFAQQETLFGEIELLVNTEGSAKEEEELDFIE